MILSRRLAACIRYFFIGKRNRFEVLLQFRAAIGQGKRGIQSSPFCMESLSRFRQQNPAHSGSEGSMVLFGVVVKPPGVPEDEETEPERRMTRVMRMAILIGM